MPSVRSSSVRRMRCPSRRDGSRGIGGFFPQQAGLSIHKHCLPSSDLLYIGLKLFPTWSKVKFLKSHTPKDNFIPIWGEVKILRLITFRQVVWKFFCKNQSPADCRGLIRIRNLNLSFGATCTEVITEAILIPISSKTHYVQLLLG